jgi:hypothetical protein
MTQEKLGRRGLRSRVVSVLTVTLDGVSLSASTVMFVMAVVVVWLMARTMARNALLQEKRKRKEREEVYRLLMHAPGG